MQPSPSAETVRPWLPRFRCCIGRCLSVVYPLVDVALMSVTYVEAGRWNAARQGKQQSKGHSRYPPRARTPRLRRTRTRTRPTRPTRLPVSEDSVAPASAGGHGLQRPRAHDGDEGGSSRRSWMGHWERPVPLGPHSVVHLERSKRRSSRKVEASDVKGCGGVFHSPR